MALGLAAISWAVYVWGVLRRPAPESPIWLAVSMTVDLGREQTIPAWWSSMLWLLLGLAAAAVGWSSGRRRWYALGVLAWGASVDEYAELHERLDSLGAAMQQYMGWELAYAWVIPGSLLAAIVGIAGVLLARSETAQTRSGLVWAGAVFLLGAVVLEVIGSLLLQHFQVVTWHFALAYHLEEVLEIIGVTMAIVAVLGSADRLVVSKKTTPSPAGIHIARS
ncbi:hypothetical protein [Granulicoccus sp. GXG6511]|uniref:hypothetical protein n=1 Tax=Granulicoccus sp. GXG6511 TaxID=3381351 RepID=UPI003D7E627B